MNLIRASYLISVVVYLFLFDVKVKGGLAACFIFIISVLI